MARRTSPKPTRKRQLGDLGAVPPEAEPYLPTIYVAAGLAVLIWVVRYWHCSEFGLYEDDYLRVPYAMQLDLAGQWKHLKFIFAFHNTQGRPFHEIFLYFAGGLAGVWGGITLLYVIGYAIVTTNAILFYSLLKRIGLGALPALLGVTAYALFPADVTSQLYLTMSFGGQPAILFFLLAAHAYLSGRRWLSLALMVPPLFGYETVFSLAAGIPLLRQRWDKKMLRQWLVYGVALFALLMGSALLRLSLGAMVRETPSMQEALTKPFRQMAVGSWTALSSFVVRPHDMLEYFRPGWLWVLAPLALALILLIDWVSIPALEWARQLRDAGDKAAWRRTVQGYLQHLLRIARPGAILLLLAYPLAFTVPAHVIHGRATRVHMAAAVGASILFACFVTAVLFLARLFRGRYVVVAGVALLFTGMAALALKVQDDYRNSWAYQRGLWHDVIRLCPDVGPNTLVLVPEGDLRQTNEISSWGWYTPEMLSDMFAFPRHWGRRPRAYMLYWNWQFRVERSGKGLTYGIDRKGWFVSDPAEPEFIVLEAGEDGLRRRTGTLTIGDQRFQLKEPGPVEEMPYPRKYLYHLLFPEGEPPPQIRYWD